MTFNKCYIFSFPLVYGYYSKCINTPKNRFFLLAYPRKKKYFYKELKIGGYRMNLYPQLKGGFPKKNWRNHQQMSD